MEKTFLPRDALARPISTLYLSFGFHAVDLSIGPGEHVEMLNSTDDSKPLSQRRPKRTIRLPGRYTVQNAVDDSVLLNFLNSDEAEMEIECSQNHVQPLTQSFIKAEVAYANAALTDPIDDQNTKDPATLQEAKSSMYWTYWLAAIYEELESLKAKGVYEDIKTLPPGRKAVGSKWVLRIKRDRDGLISRFKARLVAKGFTQIPGQDFNYTFAPVARWVSIRTVLGIIAENDMELRQIDVKTAFLNGPLDEEIYMHKPTIVGSGYWRLRKGLYGLRQAGRQWYLELNKKLESIGFKRTESDWSVYIRRSGDALTILTASVDDMLLGSAGKAESDLVVAQLRSLYEITDNGEPTLHLGCNIQRDRERRTIKLDQRAYTVSILREFGYELPWHLDVVSFPLLQIPPMKNERKPQNSPTPLLLESVCILLHAHVRTYYTLSMNLLGS